MDIIYKTLDQIMPYERNPRNNDEAIDKVANSIQEFGFKVPIIIDAAGVIVCGHTRYKAAQQLGLEEVPCIMADDLTPYQISAFRLADNKVAEFSEWDFSLLENELVGIKDNLDMSNFGFFETDSMELNDFLDSNYQDEKPPGSASENEETENSLIVTFTFDSEKEKGEILDYLKDSNFIYEIR